MNKNIVIVEDEQEIADTVAFALSRAGMVCHHALSAADGFALLDSVPCDLLILDVGLPDQDGFEVLKAVRQRGELPVIMLTAHHDEVDRVLGLELGADDYVGKPFSPRELVARVKVVLKRSTPVTQSGVISHGFFYDQARQQVLLNGLALPLTLAELRLFTHMLARPHQVFSRDQLLAAAFSANHPSDLRTIDTHIKALRHKIRNAGCAEEIIITHRALGYSVRVPS
ncbi:response regulator [Cardiobacteriaceae bacterium TAE3-ERU3]|nr:response regulator [Cardiobacteriaceae bacterium TAE3-ERU3]